ncbi:uncharacterized protein LOC129582151 isoform X2 [Paramacrobiotus metropolitanus]|uniref:uncharacterized protein LOC129582151 isoform X2 n=1 Tax=Paramacrobiotus metropolitanus TaxID=2943436 RepID=UPI0024458FDB|nr:uncharacterized protein LOC129582151 isoform X2 [Paramacrobiotus metropolitanus]
MPVNSDDKSNEKIPIIPKRTVRFTQSIPLCTIDPPSLTSTSTGLTAILSPALPADQKRLQLARVLMLQRDTDESRRAHFCHTVTRWCLGLLLAVVFAAFVLSLFSPLIAKHRDLLGLSAAEVMDLTHDYHSEYGLHCNETGCVVPEHFPWETFIHRRKRTTTDNFPLGCTDLKVTDIWNATFARLLTESTIRMLDVNGDGIDDVISGFATGGDGYNVPAVICDIYFDGQHPCFGGVMALDGRDGTLLWQANTEHEVFALNCNADLNGDGAKDCVAGGRAGVLLAIDSRNGSRLWTFPVLSTDLANFYTAQVLADTDRDNVPDLLVSHGGDPLRAPNQPVTKPGLLYILSGRTGNILQQVSMPDGGETYCSPQIYQPTEGETRVLFGTGGETHGGHLYMIEMKYLLAGRMDRVVSILSDPHKGFMVPAVLVDINNDFVVDIVIAMFNSTVVAIDGGSLKIIWRYTTLNGETYSTPAAGYYNEDNVPDFFIKYSVGAGYPVYYYAESTILDGRTGKPLLSSPIRDVIGSQSSPLTVSIQGDTDWFLYWQSDCANTSQSPSTFNFATGTKVHQQSRADFCRLRFNSHGYTRMYAINRHTGAPGIVVYDSRTVEDLERRGIIDTVAIGQRFLQTHPDWVPEKPRPRRHVGAHDEAGIQRLISTGSLAEGVPGQIDLVFATYVFYPTKTRVVLAQDEECVRQKVAVLKTEIDAKTQMRLEAECVNARLGVPVEEAESYRDLFELKMGAMTVYRKRLQCYPNGQILPAAKQSWSAYMGTTGSGDFLRKSVNK